MADTLSAVGSVSSVAGLLVSLCVLWKVRKISRSYLLRARYPDLRQKVGQHRSNLSVLLSEYPESAGEVKLEVEKCLATLKSLRQKLKGGEGKDIEFAEMEMLGSRISRSAGSPPKDAVWRLYQALSGFEQELDNLMKDMEWRT